MKDFRFNLQLFGNIAVEKWSLTPVAGSPAYYAVTSGTGTVATTATSDTSLSTGTAYVIVTTTTAGVVTATVGTADAANSTSAGADWVTFGELSLTSPSTISTFTFTNTTGGAAGTMHATKLTMTTSLGGAVSETSAGTTYQAAKGKTATLVMGTSAGVSYLTTGTLSMEAGTSGALVGLADEEEWVKATSGVVNVTEKGQVSALTSGDAFYIGTDKAVATTTGGVLYTVSADGFSITATAGAETGKNYLFTSKLDNATVTTSRKGAVIGTFSNAALADDTSLTVGTSGTVGFTGTGVTSTSYVYQNGAAIKSTGYQDTANGTLLGTFKADGKNGWSFDGSKATSGLDLADDGTSTVLTIVGSSYGDTVTASNAVKAVTINGGAGNDTIDAKLYEGASIVGGAGDDSIKMNGSAANAEKVYVGGGDGNDTILSAAIGVAGTRGWTVDAGAGNDKIDFRSFGSDVTGWFIDGGEGNNEILVDANVRSSTIKAGSGNDTITATETGHLGENTILGGAGKDVFDITAANMSANIGDYDFANDVLLVSDAKATAVGTFVNNLKSTGAIGDGTGFATVSASGNFYAANVTDANKNKMAFGWAKETASQINANNLNAQMVLVGTTNDEGDLLVAGSKSDTLYAGKGDSVYGGAGADSIKVDTNAYGVYVGVSSNSGADKVNGFIEGFDIDSADAVYLVDGSIEDTTFTNDGTNVTIKSGKGTLELENGGAATGAKILVGNKKVYSIREGAQLAVSSEDDLADYFYGTSKSGIDLTSYQDDISVDLSNSMFKNITSVTGGTSNTTIMGSKANETLFGGTGTTSLYGGAGKDSLVSGSGATAFFLATGVGKDSVSGFVSGTTDNSDTLNIFGAGISSIKRSAADTFTVKANDSDSLQIAQSNSGANEMIQWQSGDAKGVAKIGFNSTANSFTYDEEVTNYLGGSKNDTVSYGSTSDDITLWLDQQTAYSSIETFDASGVSGDVLIAGTSASETILGGTNNSSLWGGVGDSKDVLVGNYSGTNSFFYGMGQGSDSISGGSNDTMNLYDINLSDLTSAKIDTSNRQVIFTTTAGHTVTVSGGVQDFVVGGVTYTTSYASSGDWSVKE